MTELPDLELTRPATGTPIRVDFVAACSAESLASTVGCIVTA